MRKFNKLFILISIILLSFTCISCNKSDEDKLREIFELEQLNGYIDVSTEKSKIVSRIKDSVSWSDRFKREVDYYDLNSILDSCYEETTYNINNIEHLILTRYNISYDEDRMYDIEYNLKIMNLLASIPYEQIEFTSWPYVIESYNKEFKFYNGCNCGNCKYGATLISLYVYNNGFVHVLIGSNTENGFRNRSFISLIPLENGYKNIINDEILEDYIEKK